MKHNTIHRAVVATCLSALLLASPVAAQSGKGEGNDALKIAAIEALMAADDERAMPVLIRTINGDNSVEVKSRALFVLSQIDHPDAYAVLVATTRSEQQQLRMEAIRNIGINGDEALLQQLTSLYAEGDAETREAVLQAYMIADDSEGIYQVAAAAETEEEFENAVHMLGAMGATDQINRLRNHPRAGVSMVQAYAIAGDSEPLIELARDSSNPERQREAIRGLGIAGDAAARAELLALYQANTDAEMRENITQAMMIADDDESVIQLFKAATDDEEKARLLRILVIMDSDAAMEAIDEALDGGLL